MAQLNLRARQLSRRFGPRIGVDALTFGRAPAQACQVGFRPGFIEENQTRRVPAALTPPPEPARPRDVRPVLFAGPECLFLYVRSIALSA